MATLTDEMDAVAEPVRAKDELKEPEELKDELKEQLPLTEPSPSHIETKIEQVEDAIEISASPAIQTPAAQIPAHQESAESSFASKQASDSLHDRPASVDHTTPSKANSAYTASIITDQQEDGAIHNDDNNEELTPPPDSPVEDPMSRASSVPLNTLEDEIVVGTNANHNKPPSFRTTPENEDVVMADVEEKPPTGQQSKRKRISAVYADSVGDKDDSPAPSESQEARRPGRPPKAHGLGAVKGVVLGFWRDSPPENDADKHGVIGFIDVRDRLRTRIQPTTRDGRPVDQRYPIPPGPGGSWVTFDKVAFDNHLAGLNHHVVKEYVKIRVDDGRQGETLEEQAQLEREAAELATERVRNNPPPEAATQPLIAYGAVIPDNAVFPNRPETKKRRLAGSFGAPSSSPGHAQQLSIGEIPGTRPTKIPVGYWKKSSEKEFMDKHVVMGILGANDMFRVKVTRETRDGRAVNGNFPTGAGAIWIPWDEVEWDPQLRNLSRAEIKEYTRVRQRQIDLGESPDERIANETAAVIQGQQRVAQMIALGGVPLLKEDPDLPAIAMKGVATTNGNSNANGHKPTNSPASTPIAAKPDQPNQAQRSENNTRAGRRPLPDIEFRAANRAPPAPGVLERTNSLARREIARVEAAQARADLRAASREASLGPATTANNKSIFQDNVSRLNKVWAAQEANRIRAGGEDAKMYMGVKYERKQTGPFEGKLVSQGTIISIDGEDYVEYRVLTKPTFF